VERRYPLVQISWVASSVQGENAPTEVIAGLNTLNHYHECGCPLDLIVIARGGGSMEDLAAFNHEGLARAIFASTVPVVSAIGHETDYSIADFVADLRAPTPSAAAELVTPNVLDFRMQLANLRQGLIRNMEDVLLAEKACLDQGLRQLDYHSPAAVLDARRRDIEEAVMLGSRTLVHRLQVSREQVRGSALALTVLSPYQTLERGYSLCFDKKSGKLIRHRGDVSAGDLIEIQVVDGRIGSVVTELPGKNGQG
jgi:exodeoxyribonuclease VII large subunit